MTEKEAQDTIDLELIRSFNVYWKEECVEHMTYFSNEAEKTVYDLCYTSWMNGAFLRGNM